MNKKEVSKLVSHYGKPLGINDFYWDQESSTFISQKNSIVINFSGESNCRFLVGSHCAIRSGHNCMFSTLDNCRFYTGSDCLFDTNENCVFATDEKCIFVTGDSCTFDTESDCTFKTGKECVVVRRDIYEVIKPEKGKTIRLNDYKIKGYKEIDRVEICNKCTYPLLRKRDPNE